MYVPIWGSTMSFASTNLDAIKFPLLAIHKLVKVHGEVMRFTMGSDHMVFISGKEEDKPLIYSTSQMLNWQLIL